MKQIAAFRGKIDRLDRDTVSGWAKNEDISSGPIELEVFYSDQHLGDITANETRQDLSRAGVGDCAFTFSIPVMEDFKPDELIIIEKTSGTPLKRSWSPNLANNKEVRNELAELTETVKLTRKVLLAASSRNERALIGMADTVEKVTPRQLNETLNTLSYQLMQTDIAIKAIKGSTDETNERLLDITRAIRSNAFYNKLNTFLLAALVCLSGLFLVDASGLLSLSQ